MNLKTIRCSSKMYCCRKLNRSIKNEWCISTITFRRDWRYKETSTRRGSRRQTTSWPCYTWTMMTWQLVSRNLQLKSQDLRTFTSIHLKDQQAQPFNLGRILSETRAGSRRNNTKQVAKLNPLPASQWVADSTSGLISRAANQTLRAKRASLRLKEARDRSKSKA